MSWTYIIIHPDGQETPSSRRFKTEEQVVVFLAVRRLNHAELWKNWGFRVVNGKEVQHD